VDVDLGLDAPRARHRRQQGLGRASRSAALAAEGARISSSRDAAAIESTGKAIGAAGWQAADMSRPGDPEPLVKATVAKLGGLDILVVNAGGPPPGTFQTTPLEGWDTAYQLTLMSAVRLVNASLPYLKKGRIVFITSISVRSLPNIALQLVA
jgi:3-oxoacyl-[acyl-carrier protein] reductase